MKLVLPFDQDLAYSTRHSNLGHLEWPLELLLHGAWVGGAGLNRGIVMEFLKEPHMEH
jgi:hypothetical protein